MRACPCTYVPAPRFMCGLVGFGLQPAELAGLWTERRQHGLDGFDVVVWWERCKTPPPLVARGGGGGGLATRPPDKIRSDAPRCDTCS